MINQIVITDKVTEKIKDNKEYLIWNTFQEDKNSKRIFFLSDILSDKGLYYKKKLFKIINRYFNSTWKKSQLNKVFLDNFDYHNLSGFAQVTGFEEKNFYLELCKCLVAIDCIKSLQKQKKINKIIISINSEFNIFLKSYFHLKGFNVHIKKNYSINFFNETYFKQIFFLIKNLFLGIFCKRLKFKKKLLIIDIFTHLNLKQIINKKKFNNGFWNSLNEIFYKKKSMLNHLHLYYPSTKFNNLYKANKILNSIKEKNHSFIENYVSINDLFKLLYNYFFLAWKYFFFKKTLLISNSSCFYSLNKIIKNYNLDSFVGKTSIKNLIFKTCIKNLIDDLNPNTKIFYIMENQNWEIILNFLARKKNIQTNGYLHNDVRFWYFSYEYFLNLDIKYIPNSTLTHSTKTKNWLIKNLKNKTNIVNVEAVKFEKIKTFDLKNYYSTKSRNILVYLDIDNNSNIKTLNFLKDIKKKINIYVKPHPAASNSKSKMYQKYENIIFIENEFLPDDFNFGFIIITNSSSMVFSAHYNGIKYGVFVSADNFKLSPIDGHNRYFYNLVTLDYLLNKPKLMNVNDKFHNLNSKLANWKLLIN
jgi:surface carbohydrate biosynthesis protein (TIGR04326 family)